MGTGSAPGRPGDGPARRPARGPVRGPVRLPDPDTVVVPDDIRELDPELHAWRRQQALARLNRRLRRLLLTRRWERYGLSGPLLVAVLMVVALTGSLAVVFTPSAGEAPVAQPLATPARPVGRVGGLLPDLHPTLHGQPVSLRERRPALLALVPADCDCVAALDVLYRQAKEFRLRFDLLGPPPRAEELRALDGRVGGGAADVLLYDDGSLARVYDAAAEPTVLVVAADGVVRAVLRDPSPGIRAEPLLATLVTPGNHG